METIINSLSKINRQHIQFFIAILTLILFVIGAGAPGAVGDFGMRHLAP